MESYVERQRLSYNERAPRFNNLVLKELSIMCNPEESVEAESSPFLKVRDWSISPTTF
jgi:hypothetical protein